MTEGEAENLVDDIEDKCQQAYAVARVCAEDNRRTMNMEQSFYEQGRAEAFREILKLIGKRPDDSLYAKERENLKRLQDQLG